MEETKRNNEDSSAQVDTGRKESMAEEGNEATAQSGRKEEQDTAKITSFDPDEDGFEFGIEKAAILHKNINIL